MFQTNEMKTISVLACKEMLHAGEISIIDVREPWEVAICSIGGQAIPMHEIPEKVSDLKQEAAYAILCKSGKRAEAVANLLESEFHFSNVTIIDGGITEWYAQFEPTFEMY